MKRFTTVPPEPKLSRSWKNKTFILDKIAIKSKRERKTSWKSHCSLSLCRQHTQGSMRKPC